MLSSTSLLHGNCVFNRNNTVATQQGMKTYWLCKAYRISMCRARCITHQGKIISATGVHNHPPHMRGNSTSGGGTSATSGGGSTGNTGVSITNNTVPTSASHGSGVGLPAPSRFPQNSATTGNINQQNYHEHHHSAQSSGQGPPPHPAAFLPNPHMHSGNTNNSNVAPPPPPHLFLQSMPNLLVQHYPSGQSTQMVQQPTFPGQHHNIMHNYEMPTAMQQQSSPPNEHSRNPTTSFDPNEKSVGAINKDHLNDDHMPIHNAADISPTVMHNSSIKNDHVESLSHNNEIGKKMSSSDHHQVQVIDSITISPGSGHNFKMESM